MTESQIVTALWTGAFLLVHLGVIVRVILRPHREPASRVAWIVVMIVLPVIGILTYILFGETSIGRRRVSRLCAVLAAMPDLTKVPGMDRPNLQPKIPETYAHLFRLGYSVNGFEPVGGNHARLLPDSNASIESMVADIDASRDHVHLNFYIWLPDNNGLKVVEALKRAAARHVACRVMADGLGSRIMIESAHWKGMQKAGVQVATALPIGNPLLRPLRGRIDLRNHRKILVIDNRITYCGSQNCADPEFRIKAKFAPWVDAMMRFEGPIARQNQYLFASDWMAQVDDRRPQSLAAAAATSWRSWTDRAGHWHWADSAQLGHARSLRNPHLHRATRAGHYDSLLCPRRSDADRPLRQCSARCRDHHNFPGPKRLLDRRRGQSQLLR